MSKEIGSQWKTIIHITLNMLELAEKQEWQRLAQKDKTRTELIHEFFSKSVAPNDGETVAVGIRKVLELDQKIITLCKKQKDKVGAELSKINNRRQVKNAYQQFSL